VTRRQGAPVAPPELHTRDRRPLPPVRPGPSRAIRQTVSGLGQRPTLEGDDGARPAITVSPDAQKRRSERQPVEDPAGPWLFWAGGAPILLGTVALGLVSWLCAVRGYQAVRDGGAGPWWALAVAAVAYLLPPALSALAIEKSLHGDARLWVFLAYQFVAGQVPGRRCRWRTSAQLTAAAYRRVGVTLPDTAAGQHSYGTGAVLVHFEALEPGDLLFWGRRASARAEQVGIYAGRSKVVIGLTRGHAVRVLPLSAPVLGVPIGVVSHHILTAAGEAPGETRGTR
jgi:hypothetical protein